jgi:hypothetical protein
MARFEQFVDNSGVDTLKSEDAWVIVPQDGANQAFLREGQGWTVEVKSEGGIVAWSDVSRPPQTRDAKNPVASTNKGKNDRLLKLSARKNGLGRLLVTKGRQVVKIGFSVHPRKTLKISFFFLQDQSNSGTTARTKFDKSHAIEWVKGLNEVYGAQANIWFEVGKADPLPLPGLNEVVSDADVPALTKKKDGVPINVFLAGKQIRSNESDYPYGFYSVKENLIVMRDQEPTRTNGKPMLKTLAHEIAHLLNYTRKASTPGHDYYKTCGYQSDVLNTMDGNDIKIPHQRVLDWNPW